MGPTLRARLRKPSLWAVFALVCGAYAVLPVMQWFRQAPRPPLRLLAVEFPAVLLFYFAFIWLSPIPWQRAGRRPWLQGLAALAASEGLITAIVFADDLLGRGAGRAPTPGIIYLTNLCFQGPALFLVGSLMARRELLEAERLALQARSEEAQALHLKGQIHPHALFNALNGLAELMEDDPAQAEACVRAMSDVLHRILEATRQATWPLAEERALVEQFLVMESLRFADRLQVRWDWDPSTERLWVLPMLLQPLVENALKHGIAPEEAGGALELRALRDGDELRLEVRNTGADLGSPARGPADRGPADHGVGLGNLRARLALAYGDRAGFTLSREGAWTAARIRLKLSALSEAHDDLANPGGG
ncbi:MAG: histidine kinase [Holophagaceae bacterium]